jgi:hypothetical protein
MTTNKKYTELEVAEETYLTGVDALVNLIETEARKVLALRPEVKSIIDCQGVSRITLHNGRELEFSTFPRLKAALDVWYDYNQLEPGLLVGEH